MKSQYILMVEDNSHDVDLTLISFKEFGFQFPVVVVTDGAEALDFIAARGKHAGRDAESAPSLILLDLNLPKVHGLDVLKQIRADLSFRKTPVIVLTSSGDEGDITRAKQSGANLYIRKPVDFDQFENVVDKIRQLLSFKLVVAPKQ